MWGGMSAPAPPGAAGMPQPMAGAAGAAASKSFRMMVTNHDCKMKTSDSVII
jgi:hypothetical protein